jgi:hypothetical protein
MHAPTRNPSNFNTAQPLCIEMSWCLNQAVCLRVLPSQQSSNTTQCAYGTTHSAKQQQHRVGTLNNQHDTKIIRWCLLLHVRDCVLLACSSQSKRPDLYQRAFEQFTLLPPKPCILRRPTQWPEPLPSPSLAPLQQIERVLGGNILSGHQNE